MRNLARALFALVAVGLGILLTAVPASAHPLGNFTVNRYTGILVSSDGFQVDHVVDLAEIPTAQLGHRIADLPTLATHECSSISGGLRLTARGHHVRLSLVSSAASTKPGQGGLPITRITCRLQGTADLGSQPSDVRFEDVSSPGVIGWREVTAVGNRMTLTSADVPEDSVSDRLTSYPKDLLTSPLSVTSARLTVVPGGRPATLPGIDTEAHASTRTGWLSGRATGLLGENGVLAAALALLVALILGASHALTPGHGKTVMAFYLSQRADSSWRSALAVGGTVTASHTGSVLALGFLVSVSSTIVPARLYPWLTGSTGLLIVALGASLVLRARRNAEHGHEHEHEHEHEHGHEHEETRSGTWGLWVMGLVGGLVPSPSALLLLLAAVAIGRAWFGVLLVLAFGIGMAVSLAVVGLAARDLVLRLESVAVSRGVLGAHLRTLLTYGAALSICTIGVMVVARTAGGLL